MSDLVSRSYECQRCGVGFFTDGRITPDAYDSPGGFEPEAKHCPACDALGFEPPPSPCCRSLMRAAEGLLTCRECDTSFDVEAVRTWALGLDVQYLLRAAKKEDHILSQDVGDLIRRAARKLGVI